MIGDLEITPPLLSTIPVTSARYQTVLMACTPSPHSAEHAEIEIEIGSMTLSCEARSYFTAWQDLAIGESFPCDLHFESYWGEPWIGVRRATFEKPRIALRDEVYCIQGNVVGMDEEAQEMYVDCGTGFAFAMELVAGLKVEDRIESEGCFVLFFPAD